MASLLEIMEPEIDATIQRLNAKKFHADPIVGPHYSRVVSIVSSAYKRHGFIIERAILERLKSVPAFQTWKEEAFQVTNIADHIVDSVIGHPEDAFGSETAYKDGHRALQVDAIVYHAKKRSLRAYEIKRGSGMHDAGKRRSILRDLLCLQILLKSYGQARGLNVAEARAHIIFYYGQCSIDKPFSLTKDELDKHFGCSVKKPVEQVNDLFKKRLSEMLVETAEVESK